MTLSLPSGASRGFPRRVYSGRGFYSWQEKRSPRHLRSTDPAVLVLELWHDCQRQRLGDAWNREEQARREAEAHRVEIQWRQSE